MSGRLRRRYQRLLVTYPSAYRRAHGEEILGTLLEAAEPDQQLPAPREAASLLLGGLRTRAHQAATQSARRLWADGLQLGVLLIVLVNLGHALQPPFLFPLWIALIGVGALAVLRGWTRTALLATAVAALAASRPLLPQVALPWWLPGYGDSRSWPSSPGPASAVRGRGPGGGCCCRRRRCSRLLGTHGP